MVAFIDRKFSGMIPKLPAHELPDGYAQTAINCDFRHGDLRPILGIERVSNYHPEMVGKKGLFVYEQTKSFIYFNRKTNVVRHPTFGVDRYFTTDGENAYETGIIDANKHPGGGVFNGDALSTPSNPYAWPYQTIGMIAPQMAPTVTLLQAAYPKTVGGAIVDTSLLGDIATDQKYEYEVYWQKVNKDGTRQKMEGLSTGLKWTNPAMPRIGGFCKDVPVGGDAIIQIKVYELKFSGGIQTSRKLVGAAYSSNASDLASANSIADAGTTTTPLASQYPTAAGFEVYDTFPTADLYAIARNTSYDDYDGTVIATPQSIAAQKVIDARTAGTATQQSTIPTVTSGGEAANFASVSTATLENGIPMTIKVSVVPVIGADAATVTDPTTGIVSARSDVAFTLQIGDKESRIYCYTYVNKFGEESPPSPPSVEVQPDYGMGVAVNIPTSWKVGDRDVYLQSGSGTYQSGVTAMRIYRTVTASDGTTNYHLFREIGLTGTLTYFSPSMSPLWIDFLHQQHAKEVLPTIGGLLAPLQLKHLQPYSSGVLMGFTGDELCFSSDYQPYAWPIARRVKAPYQIQAAAPIANGVLLGTDGGLFIASGATPESMGVMRIPEDTTMKYPEFFMLGDAVAAFTSDGLSIINGQSVDASLSQQYWTREDWIKWASGNSAGAEGGDIWFSGGIVSAKTFNNSLVVLCETGGYLVDLEGKTLCNFFSASTDKITAAHYSPRYDELFVIAGAYVCRWGTGNPLNYAYKSKQRRLPFPVCLRAAKITLGSAGNVQFTLMADGQIKHTQEISSIGDSSQHIFRLPSGYKALEYAYHVTGNAIINEVHIAETMTELRGA